MSRVLIPACLRRGLRWVLAAHRVPRYVPLNVPHVVRHQQYPPTPPLLGIGAAHGNHNPPTTSFVRGVGYVLI